MILVITESSDTTVDYVLPALRRAGHQILVWDSGRLPRDDRLTVSIVDGEPAWRLRTPDGVHDLSAVSTVWARRPSARSLRPATSAGGHGEFGLRASRALLDGLWNTLPARWFPGPPASAGPADDKVLQLLRAVEVGFTVPDTWFGNDPQVVVPAWHHADGALITKGFDPRDAQRGGELHVAYASRVRRRDLARRHRLADAPAILQPAVPKAVEVRAIVVGDQVLSTEVASQASRLTADDWRHYTGVRDVHRPHQLPPEVAQRCLDLVTGYGLVSGSIDLILTPAGEYVFLELNVHGEWGWQHAAGLPIASAVARWLAASEADPLPRTATTKGDRGDRRDDAMARAGTG